MNTFVSDNLSNISEKKHTNILIVDDHPLFRRAVKAVLEEQNDFIVVGEAGNGVDAVKLAVDLMPDVVIMDISMPQMNGLEATRQIKAKCPNIAILAMTVYNDIEHILGVIEAGAAGYITKNAFEEGVVAAVRSVMAGETVITTPEFQKILQRTLRYPLKPLTLQSKEQLTDQEQKVLKLAAKGLSNKDISQELFLSLRTVKGYMVDIFAKMKVSSRTEAVIKGLTTGIITPDDIDL